MKTRGSKDADAALYSAETDARLTAEELREPHIQDALRNLQPTMMGFFNATTYSRVFANEPSSECFERSTPHGKQMPNVPGTILAFSSLFRNVAQGP